MISEGKKRVEDAKQFVLTIAAELKEMGRLRQDITPKLLDNKSGYRFSLDGKNLVITRATRINDANFRSELQGFFRIYQDEIPTMPPSFLRQYNINVSAVALESQQRPWPPQLDENAFGKTRAVTLTAPTNPPDPDAAAKALLEAFRSLSQRESMAVLTRNFPRLADRHVYARDLNQLEDKLMAAAGSAEPLPRKVMLAGLEVLATPNRGRRAKERQSEVVILQNATLAMRMAASQQKANPLTM